MASLADYNAGRLHGEWIDARQSPEQLHEQADQMLKQSPQPDAEEFAIHDYEGFGPIEIGEYTDLATIAYIADGMDSFGPAFAHWAAHLGIDTPHDATKFEDAYLGEWKSILDYAEHILDDLGYTDEIANIVPDHLRHYIKIDAEGFARDLQLAGDIYSSETAQGAVYIFDATA